MKGYTFFRVMINVLRTYDDWVVVSNMFAVFYTQKRDPGSDSSAS